MNRPLEAIDLKDSHNVENWFERFELLKITDDSIKDVNEVAFVLTLMGREAYNLLKDLVFPQLPKSLTVDQIKEYLVNHVKPKNLEIHERAIFPE